MNCEASGRDRVYEAARENDAVVGAEERASSSQGEEPSGVDGGRAVREYHRRRHRMIYRTTK